MSSFPRRPPAWAVHRARPCERFWAVPNDRRGELRWCLSKTAGFLDEPIHKHVRAENDWMTIDASTVEVDAPWVRGTPRVNDLGAGLDRLKNWRRMRSRKRANAAGR